MTSRVKLGLIAAVAVVAVAVSSFAYNANQKEHRLEQLTTSFGPIDSIPDPADIQLAFHWYFLNHISSPLISFDHDKGVFAPLLAESWAINGSVYRLKVRADARFSDGSPITSRDVAATIKRQLALKSATHFPLWTTIKGGDSVKTPESDCEGVRIIDHRTLDVELTNRSESFFLFLSSPESGIWSADDIGDSLKWRTPSRYSGPYDIESKTSDGFMLAANEFSPLQAQFPNGPRKVFIKTLSKAAVEEEFAAKKLDTFLSDYIPRNKYDWTTAPGVKVHLTTPSSVSYLLSLHKGPIRKIGQNLIKSAWELADHSKLLKADTFLPFSPQNSLPPDSYLPNLPEDLHEKVKIVTFTTYYQDLFLTDLKAQAAKVDVELTIERLPPQELFAELGMPSGRWDYALIPYAASERYPAVQLRYMASAHLTHDDLKDADQPDHSEARTAALRGVQNKLIAEQRALPLFFVRTNIMYRDHLDAGNQPATDCEIQLWKFTEARR